MKRRWSDLAHFLGCHAPLMFNCGLLPPKFTVPILRIVAGGTWESVAVADYTERTPLWIVLTAKNATVGSEGIASTTDVEPPGTAGRVKRQT